MQQNILMIHVESWDGRMLGCQGFHPAMADATPHIDALARRGTRFANAYCTNPICCPSRANMLSGTYTHECESWNNFKGLETGMWTCCLARQSVDSSTQRHRSCNPRSGERGYNTPSA